MYVGLPFPVNTLYGKGDTLGLAENLLQPVLFIKTAELEHLRFYELLGFCRDLAGVHRASLAVNQEDGEKRIVGKLLEILALHEHFGLDEGCIAHFFQLIDAEMIEHEGIALPQAGAYGRGKHGLSGGGIFFIFQGRENGLFVIA